MTEWLKTAEQLKELKLAGDTEILGENHPSAILSTTRLT
jgi:hypothetical protein